MQRPISSSKDAGGKMFHFYLTPQPIHPTSEADGHYRQDPGAQLVGGATAGAGHFFTPYT
jgi:hypothetical protein